MTKLNLLVTFFLVLCCLWSAEALEEFDKSLPWGKRDYSCLKFNTPRVGSKLRPGQIVHLKWTMGECGFSGREISDFNLRLYNSLEYSFVAGAPQIKYSYNEKIAGNIPNDKFTYAWRVPDIKMKGIDRDLFYIRVTTSSMSNPQQPTLFGISGPFTILRK